MDVRNVLIRSDSDQTWTSWPDVPWIFWCLYKYHSTGVKKYLGQVIHNTGSLQRSSKLPVKTVLRTTFIKSTCFYRFYLLEDPAVETAFHAVECSVHEEILQDMFSPILVESP